MYICVSHDNVMFYDLNYIGTYLKRERTKRQITQAPLAAYSGVSRATINALENLKAKDISVNTLSMILNAFAKQSISSTLPELELVKKSQPSFDFPYVWSNTHTSDELLIDKVLERALFKDVLTLCAHYGVPKVSAVLYSSSLKEDAILMHSLQRMLTNIQKGFADA
jgi:transcriptional regulator with XRE-family HTH domain